MIFFGLYIPRCSQICTLSVDQIKVYACMGLQPCAPLCLSVSLSVSLASGVCCVVQEELSFDQKIVAFASSVFIQKITTN